MKKDLKEKFKREKNIAKAINIVWTSLESHLFSPYYGKGYLRDDIKFHKNCVKEYIELMKIIAELY